MTSQCPTAVDKRHRKRAAVAMVAAAAIAGVAAHAVIMHVPKMVEDQPAFVRDRDGVLQIDPVEVDQVLSMSVMMGTMDVREHDDDLEIEQEPPPPAPDVLIPGTITLRTDKSPLERIARAPR